MNDIFREVDEEYRQQQLLEFWHKNAKFIIAILLAAIAAAAITGYWQTRQLAGREAETYRLSSAEAEAADQKAPDAATTLNKTAAELTGSHTVPASFAAARAAVFAGDMSGATKIYDGIAGNAKANAAEKQLAAVMSVSIQLKDGDPAQLSARLDKMTADDNSFRFSAREWQALLALRQGDTKKAHDISLALARDNKAPEGVRGRAGQLASLTGEGMPADPKPVAVPENGMPVVTLPETK